MGIFNRRHQTVSISGESIVKILAVGTLFFLFINALGNITHQLTLIGVSFFLAIALNPAVSYLTKKLKSKSRTRATGVAYFLVLSVLTGLLFLIVPPLVQETSDFVDDLPQTIENFQQKDTPTGRFIDQYNLDNQLETWSENLRSQTDDLTKPIVSTAGRAAGTLVSIITVLVLTFMMLVEGPMWFDRFLALQPADKRTKRKEIAMRMYKVVTGYVNGQVLIAFIAAVFAMIALLIGNMAFDTSVNVVALAGITFIFALIPLIGNIIGAVIIVLMCLFASTPLAIAMAIYFIVYQQIENATLQPYIQSRGNQLTPLMVFIAALIGAGIGGLLGALAAIPTAGCLVILSEGYLERRRELAGNSKDA